MVSKELVGTRIRQARIGQRKTLKDVEATSGFSSTHISEIERGRTSPTIGALIRIAHALDKDPSYFIEERQLEEVSVTTAEERPETLSGLNFTGSGHRLICLTRGILGGRLLAYELHLDPDGEARISHLPDSGDVGLTCLNGSCEMMLGVEQISLNEGDSLHLAVEDAKLTLRGGGQSPSKLMVIVDPKETMG